MKFKCKRTPILTRTPVVFAEAVNKAYLDLDMLFEKYAPLRKSVLRVFQNYFESEQERLELEGQVHLEFINLVRSYDSRRGVDFPYYIKKMLNFRVHQYVTKRLKVINNESVTENVYDITGEEPYEDDTLEYTQALMCLDDNIKLTNNYRRLIQGILVDRKPLEQIAEEEHTDIKTLRLRLYFLCKKLKRHDNELEECYAWKNGEIPDVVAEYEL